MPATQTPAETLSSAVSGYAPGEDRPLAAYGALMGAFGTALAATIAALRATGRELPERPSTNDLLLIGIATHKVSRIVTRDKLTSTLRAPFTRYQDAAGHGEVDEQPRGSGMRLALGELAVCPYCLSQWVASAFAVGFVAAPRTTRFIAGIQVATTLSDVLQLAYKAAEDRV
jgi:hypothetical protein